MGLWEAGKMLRKFDVASFHPNLKPISKRDPSLQRLNFQNCSYCSISISVYKSGFETACVVTD